MVDVAERYQPDAFVLFSFSNNNADYPLADFKEKKLRPFCYSIFLN